MSFNLRVSELSFWVRGLNSEDKDIRAGAVNLIDHLIWDQWFWVASVADTAVRHDEKGDEEWARVYYGLLDKAATRLKPVCGHFRQAHKDSRSKIMAPRSWVSGWMRVLVLARYHLAWTMQPSLK